MVGAREPEVGLGETDPLIALWCLWCTVACVKIIYHAQPVAICWRGVQEKCEMHMLPCSDYEGAF